MIWVANRKRSAIDTRPEIDDYTLLHITIRKDNLFQNAEAALSVRNLFDSDAREPSRGAIQEDYPLEGRSVMAEIRYKF